ncbi:Bug family tripartite tricarboxylate transporter substrate binding protein [Muricoccus radiodurans]|uniref:Bug family tripartite tricarboxylate transporter substrate binding protein n=1 Tax=Muricoccus radiodurans TaxID=2231721 RepID=UPI003CEC43E1
MLRRGLLLGAAALAVPALAQSFPSRPVTLVAGFPAGTSVDLFARWLAERLSRALGQPVIVENRPGADGATAAAFVARARPDGHTILYTTSSTHGASPSLYTSLPFDPVADFAPVAKLLDQPLLLLVRPDGPASVGALVAAAQVAPRLLFYGHGNTSTRVAAELLRSRAGLRLERVPYRGNPQSIQDLIAGRLDFAFTDFTTGIEQVRAGALRSLAVTSAARNPQLSETPTLAESGFPGFELVAWGGVVAPAATPEPVVQRLSNEIIAIMRAPEASAFGERIGIFPAPQGPTEFGPYIRAEIARWADYVAVAGIEKQ